MTTAARNSLTLISHHLCPYVQRAAIALAEKDVAFDRQYVDLANKPDWFKEISPLGKVPLLVVGRSWQEGAILFESNVICEYIEDTEGGPRLHPKDALARAQHRAWMEFGSAILGDLWGFETATEQRAFDAKRVALRDKFARMEAALADGPYFAGADFGLVDAVFAPIFRYFDVFDGIAPTQVLDGMPKLARWREALASRRSVIDAVTDDYPERLRCFLVDHDAYLLKVA